MVDWDWVATVVMIMVVVGTVGGVVLLLPVSRKLGALLEAMTRERQDSPQVRGAISRLRQSMDTLEDRVELLEEKQDFTEELLGDRNRRRLRASPEKEGPEESE